MVKIPTDFLCELLKELRYIEELEYSESTYRVLLYKNQILLIDLSLLHMETLWERDYIDTFICYDECWKYSSSSSEIYLILIIFYWDSKNNHAYIPLPISMEEGSDTGICGDYKFIRKNSSSSIDWLFNRIPERIWNISYNYEDTLYLTTLSGYYSIKVEPYSFLRDLLVFSSSNRVGVIKESIYIYNSIIDCAYQVIPLKQKVNKTYLTLNQLDEFYTFIYLLLDRLVVYSEDNIISLLKEPLDDLLNAHQNKYRLEKYIGSMI